MTNIFFNDKCFNLGKNEGRSMKFVALNPSATVSRVSDRRHGNPLTTVFTLGMYAWCHSKCSSTLAPLPSLSSKFTFGTNGLVSVNDLSICFT
ncbi:hypothetical protein GOP47_0020093 [Adiantum capillus-veneris]|uniref:Uncharacterized protein n=1 Tax=Adiantum capillus-veneris TaxID=13818 RepID=A0A9D4UCB5_ADICA|nr:hypothetical protein GOP47_0020093 [Adiantum capillus-veneris]